MNILEIGTQNTLTKTQLPRNTLKKTAFQKAHFSKNTFFIIRNVFSKTLFYVCDLCDR